MKITKSRLKQIIKEELERERLSEIGSRGDSVQDLVLTLKRSLGPDELLSKLVAHLDSTVVMSALEDIMQHSTLGGWLAGWLFPVVVVHIVISFMQWSDFLWSTAAS